MAKLDEVIKKLGIDRQTYVYQMIMVISFCIWMILVFNVRGKIEDETAIFYLGFIPNFFAAICMFYYLLYKRKTSEGVIVKQLTASRNSLSVSVFATLFLAEIVQEYILNGVFDPLDLLASLVGIIFSQVLLTVLNNRQAKKGLVGFR